MDKVFVPRLYLIAGPNGAGKTTASMRVLPKLLECEEFVNADEIARGLSPFHPEDVAFTAGRLQLERIKELIEKKATFSIETTLATKTYKDLVESAHKAGYAVELLFFYLPSAQRAVERVKQRVLSGGHNIPEDVIHRRYSAGLKNLVGIYIPIVDRWQILDNSDTPSRLIAECEDGKVAICDEVVFEKIKSYGRNSSL